MSDSKKYNPDGTPKDDVDKLYPRFGGGRRRG